MINHGRKWKLSDDDDDDEYNRSDYLPFVKHHVPQPLVVNDTLEYVSLQYVAFYTTVHHLCSVVIEAS